MKKYQIAGLAFSGDRFDYTVESDLDFFDFVSFDANDLCGTEGESFANMRIWNDLNVVFIDTKHNHPRKAIIEGLERLYMITEVI